jgi:hypothetical protein
MVNPLPITGKGNLVFVRRYEVVNYQAMEFAREEIDSPLDLQRSKPARESVILHA